MTNEEITYQTKSDGSLSKVGQRRALADLAVMRAEAVRMLDEFQARYDATGEVAETWNDVHDAVTAIDSDIRMVEINRRPIRDETDRLIAENRD